MSDSAMDVEAAARGLGVSHDTVLRYIRRGLLPAFQLPGRHWRIKRQDYNAFLKAANRDKSRMTT